MSERVEVAIFDNDQKIRTMKKYDVSENGVQIRIKSGGEGHFMPKFDSTSFLDFPSWKRYIFFGPRTWKRLYFVKNKGEKCVDFSTGETYGPSPEEMKKAISATLLGKIGQGKLEIPWYLTVLLLLNTIFLVAVMKVLGVF